MQAVLTQQQRHELTTERDFYDWCSRGRFGGVLSNALQYSPEKEAIQKDNPLFVLLVGKGYSRADVIAWLARRDDVVIK
jgi:hypothetical protein